MRFERIEAKPLHCGQLARTLRTEHRRILSDMQVPTHHELRAAFDASIMRRAWLMDGVLSGIAGLTATAASSEGVLWLAITDEAAAHPFHVAREALRFLKEVMMTRRRVSTTMLADDKAGVQLAYFLGFNTDERTTINGASVLVMSYAVRKAA